MAVKTHRCIDIKAVLVDSFSVVLVKMHGFGKHIKTIQFLMYTKTVVYYQLKL